MTNLVDAAGTTAYRYAAGGQLWTEDGPFSNDTVTNSYTSRLRTGLALQQPTGLWTNGFWYDYAKRLTNVTSQAGTFAYTYHASRITLLDKLSLPNTSYITNTYDSVALRTGTWLKKSDHTTLNSHQYTYNVGNQRTRQTFTDASTVGYTYDAIGQLKVADSSVNTQDRGYAYDAAWNLNYRTNNTTLHTFKVDGLNQLTNATPVGTQTYDDNGNLRLASSTGAADWVDFEYVYDDENRLVNWYNYYDTYLGSGVPTSSDDLRTDFVYDGQGRLRKRVEYWAGGLGGWSLVSETRYVYDGWRVIQERNSGNTPTVSYTRGNDLSGSLEGAGGIGGLLARSHGYSSGTGNWITHNCYHADGNGNVTYLVNSSQALAASYRYDAYGNTLSLSGSLAQANVYRFSSKELHANSGVYYYGYRWYHPNLQRWPNRDPLASGRIAVGATALMENEVMPFEFQGGGNLYQYVYNHPVAKIDPRGLDIWVIKDLCGLWGHVWVVGENGDGTYWDVSKFPIKKGLRRAACREDIQFNANSGFHPRDEWAYGAALCHKIIVHVETTPEVDSRLRDAAEKQDREDKGYYIFPCDTCRDYARQMVYWAKYAMENEKTR